MRMEVYVRPNEVEVIATGRRRPGVAQSQRLCMPNELAERGRGLAMARTVLERLHYCRDLVNCWTLVSKQFA